MDKEPSEPDIEKLLADLRSGGGPRRKAAAQTIAKKEIVDPQLIDELVKLSTSDPYQYVQYTAVQTLKKLGYADKTPGYTESQPVWEPSRNEKIRDFAIGFLGWYIINGALWLIINPGPLNGGSADNALLGCFSFPPNILSLLIFAAIKRTRWIAFGILCALTLNLAISLIIGMSFNGWCFIPFYIK